MEQEVKIKVNIQEGFEATGEYRIPKLGEYVLAGDDGDVCIWNGRPFTSKVIVRKKETFADILNSDVIKSKHFGSSNRLSDYACKDNFTNIFYFDKKNNPCFAILENGKWYNAKIVKDELWN